MRKNIIFLACFSIIFLSGCKDIGTPKNSSSSDTAESEEIQKIVVRNWLQAIIDRDNENANKNSVENTHTLNNLMISSMNKENKKKLKEILRKLDDAEVEAKEDTAIIIIDGKPKYTLDKVNGKWKVNLKIGEKHNNKSKKKR